MRQKIKMDDNKSQLKIFQLVLIVYEILINLFENEKDSRLRF